MATKRHEKEKQVGKIEQAIGGVVRAFGLGREAVDHHLGRCTCGLPVFWRLTRFGGWAGFVTGLVIGISTPFPAQPADTPAYVPPPTPMDWWLMIIASLTFWAFVGGSVGIMFGAIGGGVAGFIVERKELAAITPRHQRSI